MPAPLPEFVKTIAGFDSWNHAEKIRFFAWFLHVKQGRERFNSTDIKGCYGVLHLQPPQNVSQFLANMENRVPKEALKDSRGYYLARHVREQFDKYNEPVVDTNPKTEKVLPSAVVANTRQYLERIIQQANGCYEHGWFDACSVMIRKFVEILIIEVYEAHGKAKDIKDRNDNFFVLGDLVNTILKDVGWHLGRESKDRLPEIKSLGDRSAHNRRFVAIQPDVDKVLPGLRVIADELLHLAKLK